MATAVKNQPDTTAPSLFDRPAAISLVGVVYIVGSLGIVFKLLPYLIWDVVGHLLYGDRGLNTASNANNVIVAGMLLLAATGLVVLGLFLLGPRAAHGTRAGIFVGVIGVLLILLLTRWASLWFEHWAYDDGLFGPTVGVGLTALVGCALLLVGGYFFLHPRFELFLQNFENQGWFSATTYKSLQGLRVRRGTVAGILVLVGAGIYTMYHQGTLRRMPMNWTINIPFTGKVAVDLSANDFRTELLRKKLNLNQPAEGQPIVYLDRYTLRDFNNGELSKYVRIEEQGGSTFEPFQIVTKDDFNKAVEDLRKSGNTEPKASSLEPIRGTETFATLPLLPLIGYTVPIILLALTLWMAWRIVNYPTFADFLIATEAELNKVSWSKRKDLVKDTIVVLATVFLMAVYLFAMDQAWSHLLSWQPIRILQIPKEANDSNKSVDTKPW